MGGYKIDREVYSKVGPNWLIVASKLVFNITYTSRINNYCAITPLWSDGIKNTSMRRFVVYY